MIYFIFALLAIGSYVNARYGTAFMLEFFEIQEFLVEPFAILYALLGGSLLTLVGFKIIDNKHNKNKL